MVNNYFLLCIILYIINFEIEFIEFGLVVLRLVILIVSVWFFSIVILRFLWMKVGVSVFLVINIFILVKVFFVGLVVLKVLIRIK